MKICLSVNSSPWSRFKGGGQIAVHFLASALSKLGHDVHVIYSKRVGEVIDVSADYHIHWVRHFNMATINLNVFSFGFKAWQLIRKHKFDILHGNAEEAFFFRWVARNNATTHIFTSHAPFMPKTGILKGFFSPVFFLKNINFYLLRQVATNADRLIAFSKFSRNLIVSGLGSAYADRVQVVTPGIDSSWFNVTRNSDNCKDIVFWGRLEDEKGIPELLKAMKLIQQGQDSSLNLIGEGNKEVSYKKLVQELGLKVNFLRWKSQSEIQDFVSKSALGVFPSRIESFGLAVAEAQAANLPVVCTKVGALPEIIEDGITGRMVSSQSPKDLAKAILEALENKKQSNEMAQLGREKAKRRFSWEVAAKKTVRIYKEGI